MLFGEQSVDEARDSGAVREDADDVGPATDLLVQTLLRIVGPDLTGMALLVLRDTAAMGALPASTCRSSSTTL